MIRWYLFVCNFCPQSQTVSSLTFRFEYLCFLLFFLLLLLSLLFLLLLLFMFMLLSLLIVAALVVFLGRCLLDLPGLLLSIPTAVVYWLLCFDDCMSFLFVYACVCVIATTFLTCLVTRCAWILDVLHYILHLNMNALNVKANSNQKLFFGLFSCFCFPASRMLKWWNPRVSDKDTKFLYNHLKLYTIFSESDDDLYGCYGSYCMNVAHCSLRMLSLPVEGSEVVSF